ncbi:MAG: type II secretion system protein GspG, partial [Kiritimatiellae bacterium]|nr:type II secretion system protein GspG [Kiritimatiellia bacterium]
MVSYQKLKKKFPVKKGALSKSKKAAAIKAIAQEYEIKKAELGMGPPQFKRGFPYYMVIIIGLLIVGALVGSAISERGGIDIAQQNVKKTEKSLSNLAIALGRYRYHVGTFPTTEEGLEQLSQTRLSIPGWVGPYIKAVKSDPWKNPYVYIYNGETSLPTLFSKGVDGKAGTSDDIIAKADDFEAAFRDTSWTEGWVPWHLRDIILADSKAHKVIIERQVADALAKNSITDGGVEICDGWKFTAEGAEGVEVCLPHDWAAPGLIAGSGCKRGTYTRSFFAEKDLEGKFVALRLDGVSGEFKVRLNGKDLLVKNAGEYGYEVDLRSAIKYGGDNLLEIDVESNDLRKGAGITAKATLVAEENEERVVYGSLRVTALRADAKTANIRVEREVVKVEGCHDFLTALYPDVTERTTAGGDPSGAIEIRHHGV